MTIEAPIRPASTTTTGPRVRTPGARALDAAPAQFEAAADQLALDDGLRAILRVPQREYTVNFPVRLDDGSIRVFTGYRVQHNTARGPAKGGVTCDSRTMSPREVEAVTRRFATELEPMIGPESDIPAPDVGTNAQTMAWLMDTVSMHRGFSVPGVVTGKPLAIGGSVGRADATGQGVVYAIEDAATRGGFTIEGSRVAIQGFGNVGEATARLLHLRGARVIAITDIDGGVYDADGLDVPRLSRFLTEHGTVAGAPGTTPIDNESLFALDVDVLVLAALEGQITAANAGSVRARILAEAANGPVAPEADPVLARNGVVVLPDILCNAGGVIVSYFEWAQNRAALAWTLAEVNQRLRTQMLAAADAVWERAARDGISPRLAAHVIAVERVADATRLRGLYP
jgi:glutamate dehydrogenase (NAD(P)+)